MFDHIMIHLLIFASRCVSSRPDVIEDLLKVSFDSQDLRVKGVYFNCGLLHLMISSQHDTRTESHGWQRIEPKLEI